MLNFVGRGSAFNTKLGNTSAFIKHNSSLILIDCGGTVFSRLQELKILDGLKNLYIVITHTHPDHVGSLGDIIFYCYHILKYRPTIIFPQKEHMEKLLTSIGVTNKVYQFNSSDRVEIRDEQIGEFSIEFLSVAHTNTIPSYGFIMKINGNTLYYSGDSNNISNEILNKLKSGEIQRIYQDTCGLDYKGNGHLSLKKLSELIPKELKYKVYSMHLDQHITEEEIRSNGFNVVEIL